MIEFSRYYINFIREFFHNLIAFFSSIINAFVKFFFTDIKYYITSLINASNKFNALDWIAEFVVIVINCAFFGFLFLRLFQFLKRYIRFTKREIEKEELLDEIAMLNLKTAELVDEKNKILALKVSNITGGEIPLGEGRLQEEQKEKARVVGDSRFVKLTAVDEFYKNRITSVTMKPEDMIGLPELVERFVGFAASQLNLFYEEKVIRLFFAGMATSKILILEGISGTGKTSLPYAMGKFFGKNSDIVSVQPSWRDRAELIGYLNEFTKRFNETEFLKALYEATYREDLNFIILDEMNLARIEYYFAEFLSMMEMPDANEWKIDIVPDVWPTDPKNFQNGKLLVPQNVWFVGTANRDDSTFTITDKVYDRATSIEINYRAQFIDAPFTEGITMSYDYLDQLFKKAHEEFAMSVKTNEKLMQLDSFIAQKFKVTFGNRILKQIRTFVPVYIACGGSEIEALDYLVMRKILRKFESLNVSFLHQEISDLIIFMEKTFGKNAFQESIRYLNELIKSI